KDADLNGSRAHALAHYWQRIMKSLIRGDAQIYEAITKIYQNEGAEAASWGTMDEATFEYILKKVAFASLADDLQLHISEQNYTPEAIEVIRIGQNAIRELNMDVFGSEAMLLGLVSEGSNVAAQILTAAGVTFDAAQLQIVQMLGSRPTPPVEIPTPPHLPFAPRAKRVLELAREQAEQLGQPRISPEHLLIGILRETEEVEAAGQAAGVAARVLREGFNVNFDQLEQQLRSTMA
ncbi:MAG: Clp protease N-terminal domain-containing protein, partial [Leptolyngbyaceae cyanobacterium MO_188.B28]|nr:Clp protease N-terminal domain-containing protein [Leptolyngbyaceae cyanobacterium MO_188.B28]